MTEFLQTLSNVFSTFGATVFVPIILFIIGMCMGAPAKKAFQSALLCAVGLTGFNFVVNSYSAIIAPVVDQMVTNAGVNLPGLDTGWQSVSVIAYSTKVGVLFIGVAIVPADRPFLGEVDGRFHGIRPLEQLFVHGLGLADLCPDGEHDACDGLHDYAAALYPAVL